MVLLSPRGYTVEQIAEIFGVGDDVVRTWLHRYARTGPLAFNDGPRQGRPLKDRLASPRRRFAEFVGFLNTLTRI